MRQDWSANAGRPESQLLLLLFRGAQWSLAHVRPRLLARAVVIAYRVLSRALWGVELPAEVIAGPGLRIHHGQALVVNPSVVLGARCTLRHSTTLGNKREGDARCPVLGDDVDVGVGAVIIGPVRIGDGARIGANAVVVDDVPAGVTVIGNPAHPR